MSLRDSPEAVIADYRSAYQSRVASLVVRREVFSGRAKFGGYGDGKEVAQVALARVFSEGDWRAGYYRDQTLMFTTGMLTIRQFFAQLYADSDITREPASMGRQMNAHFATRFLDANGEFTASVQVKNSAADCSPVASNMPIGLGLAYASKLYRGNPGLQGAAQRFSRQGNEVCFATLGDGGCAEGLFLETINAAAVLQVPLVVCIWDDGYGISVPTTLQTAKASISEALMGFTEDNRPGLLMYRVAGWDYPSLRDAYVAGVTESRRRHVPAFFHITELTQPQGHSTSGSHEHYKSTERLEWEAKHDCLSRMRTWMEEVEMARSQDLARWEEEDEALVNREQDLAWREYQAPLLEERAALLRLLAELAPAGSEALIHPIMDKLSDATSFTRKQIQVAGLDALVTLRDTAPATGARLQRFLDEHKAANQRRYTSHLYSSSSASPLAAVPVATTYEDDAPEVDGRLVLTHCFEANFRRDPRLFVIGEDVGRLGDVNLVFEGLYDKFGDLRFTDTGIREATIVGQAIGCAMRGLRPIADVQYIDYLLYALELISDQLATLHWRTAGGQKAPIIIRTKGHRLQGIWHAGSPMGTVLSSMRGVYLAVPRNMTQAAGLYNVLLRGDNPAIVVETLNAYRMKERLPANVGDFTIPLGVPEMLREGKDITLVTYGACCAIALEAAEVLSQLGIYLEVIDVVTLNPFDISGVVARSLRKTGALVLLDEDVPGGASAYMLRELLESKETWWDLDSQPRTITAADCRPAYASDGEYFTKPNREDVVRVVSEVMAERRPADFGWLLSWKANAERS